jgi:hypothetical protein
MNFQSSEYGVLQRIFRAKKEGTMKVCPNDDCDYKASAA